MASIHAMPVKIRSVARAVSGSSQEMRMRPATTCSKNALPSRTIQRAKTEDDDDGKYSGKRVTADLPKCWDSCST